MFPSTSLAQEIGLAVLLVAAIGWFAGRGHILRNNRFHHPEPSVVESLPMIPAQRSRAAHPMESVQLTEEEEQAFVGLVRSLPLR